LQRERQEQLHVALEVEKEIAQTDTLVREAIRQRDRLLSAVAQAPIQLMLLEDFALRWRRGSAGRGWKLATR
jgi:hypothetical protein